MPAATRGKYTLSKSAPSTLNYSSIPTQIARRHQMLLQRAGMTQSAHGIITSTMPRKSARSLIGILALQGDFDAHRKMLSTLPDVEVTTVRTPEELSMVDALVLPGGESTTLVRLLSRSGLMQPLRDRLSAGMPAYGTCAGLILLAKSIVGHPDQPTIGALNVSVDRNAFGRQVDSFEADVPFPMSDDQRPAFGACSYGRRMCRALPTALRLLPDLKIRLSRCVRATFLPRPFTPS